MTLRRLLYVGQLFEGGTCLDRMRCLQDIGCSVIPFDTTSYVRSGGAIKGRLAHRFNWGAPLTSLNEDLVKFARSKAGEFNILWVDKGKWIWSETLRQVKGSANAKAVHFTPDAQFVIHRSRHFARAGPSYDLAITTKEFELPAYRNHGFRNVHLTGQGFERSRHYPRPTTTQIDVLFVGHMERHYKNILTSLANRIPEISIGVAGPGWKKAKRSNSQLSYLGEGFWGEEYAVQLSRARICLGLLSKKLPETITTRSFEIPACGSMLLGERTKAHLAAFIEGKEAEFFSSIGELAEKVRTYLSDETKRSQMAEAGRARANASGYSNHDRLVGALVEVDRLFSSNAK